MLSKILSLTFLLIVFQQYGFSQWHNFSQSSTMDDFKEVYGIPFSQSIADTTFLVYLDVKIMERNAQLFVFFNDNEVESIGYKFTNIIHSTIDESISSIDKMITEEFGTAEPITMSFVEGLTQYEKRWIAENKIIQHRYRIDNDSLSYQHIGIIFENQ